MHRIALPPCELTLELLHIQRYPLQAHCAPHHGWPFGSCKRGSSGRVALLPALITIKHIKGDIEHLQQKVNDKKKSFEKLQWCLDKQNESQCAGHQQCGAPARPSQRCTFKTGVWGRDDLLVMPAPALLRHAIMQPASAAHLSHTVVRLILLKVLLSPSLPHGRLTRQRRLLPSTRERSAVHLAP